MDKLVSYEIAKLAKEKGFDKPCQAVFEVNSFTGKDVITEISTQTAWKLDDMKKAVEFMERTGRVEFFNKETKNSNLNEFLFARPTYQGLLDWLREKHFIHIYAQYSCSPNEVLYFWYVINFMINEYIESNIDVNAIDMDEEKTLEKALEKVLKLIK
jgi:hypothetical protein